jgi:hypothetical protein
MAVTFEPKRRLRLPSGDLPEPKVVHSRSWLPYALVVWLLVVAAGHGILYGWLPLPVRTASTITVAPPDSPIPLPGDSTPPMRPNQALAPIVTSPTVTSPARAIQPTAVDPDNLPACEAVADTEATTPENVEPLPVDLSRSPFGALLDIRSWTNPCRSAHSIRVHLCVAVKAGQLLGATADTDPDDPSTARCIIHAAAKLALEPDAALRKVHITIDLPPEHTRH